jgi:hypothetical protein
MPRCFASTPTERKALRKRRARRKIDPSTVDRIGNLGIIIACDG